MGHFKRGFSKLALDPLSLLTTAALPSIGKRFSEEAFDHAKRQGMGLPTQNKAIGRIVDPVLKGLDKIDAMDDGLKKKVLRFSTEEGPGVLISVPAKRGKRLGKTLKAITDIVPFGVSEKNMEFLAQLTDANEKSSGKALDVLKKRMHKAKGLALKGGLGALGLLGFSLMAGQLLKKEEGSLNPLITY